MRKITLTLMLSAAPLTMTQAPQIFAAEHAEAPEVSLKEFKTIVAKGDATIIDVNSPEMFKDGHVPGAFNFELAKAEFAKKLPAKKDALIIAYCGGPRCLAWKKAAAEAAKLGYTNIKHFKGGIAGWKKAGEKVEKGA